MANDQAFIFNSTAIGGMSIVDDAGVTVVRFNTNSDTAFEFSIRIEDGATPATSYNVTDFVL